MDFKKFDFKALNRYFSPRAMDDVNRFLEKMPQNAGKTALISGGIAWAMAAVLGLYASVMAQDLTNLRAQLQDAQALKPIVPQISEVPVDAGQVEPFVTRMKKVYPNLVIQTRQNEITVTAQKTTSFGAFREAISHIQNGGQGWKVAPSSLCVGRECKQNQLSIILKINRINVDRPMVTPVTYSPKSSSSTDGAQP